MGLLDWIIVLLPLTLVAYIGLKTQKYVRGVSDFLSAGRVAGRYVVAVASGEAAMGLVSLVAMFEAYYNSGLAYSFWNSIGTPLAIIFTLTGFCIYRYRETRAMTMGQFLEIRYSRPFRIFAGILQSISGIINYAIFPAVGARFLVYFCDLPLTVNIGGFEFQTFMLVMAIFLSVAVFVAVIGGQITIMVTDCVQGIISYPLYAIIVVYILLNFSWFDDIAPAMLNRPEGKSMLNPFNIDKLRNFNLFYVTVGIFSRIFNRMSWSGTQGYNSAALNAHEQKMGQVLGMWRTGFSTMMYVLLGVSAFAFLHMGKYAAPALEVRNNLAIKAMDDVVPAEGYETVREEITNYVKTGKLSPEAIAMIKKVDDKQWKDEKEIFARKVKNNLMTQEQADAAIAKRQKEKAKLTNQERDPDEILTVTQKIIQSEDLMSSTTTNVAVGKSRTFATIFGQMRVPLALRKILPLGITGAFCALCVFLLISTDTTYLHSWGSIIVQDVILPIRGKPFTPHQQLLLLRIIIACVAFFAFIFSSYFSQVDFILMFFAITGAIWQGGAGPCIVGGLYWKRGTTAGAFTALIVGSAMAVMGIVMQQIWASHIVPAIEARGLVSTVAVILETASKPFEPYIQWRWSYEKFPINSQEIFFFAMLLSVTLYVVVSLLTCRKPFNMDRMLHRGKYQREGEKLVLPKITWKNWLTRLVGIDSQYTKGDKAIAWSVFIWSFGWGFGSFLVIVVWNKLFHQWPKEWWGSWYFIASVVVPGIIAAISTVWFTIGGIWDLNRLFKRLAAKNSNILDDGRVIDNVSADDIEMVENIDHVKIPEAHIEEKILRDELSEEGDVEDVKNLDELTKR